MGVAFTNLVNNAYRYAINVKLEAVKRVSESGKTDEITSHRIGIGIGSACGRSGFRIFRYSMLHAWYPCVRAQLYVTKSELTFALPTDWQFGIWRSFYHPSCMSERGWLITTVCVFIFLHAVLLFAAFAYVPKTKHC